MLKKKLTRLMTMLAVVSSFNMIGVHGATNDDMYGENKLFKNLSSTLESVEKREDFKGNKTVYKPLVVLMEFPDYNHEKMEEENTPRKFKDWSEEHYNKMIFGEEFYEGPKGEKLFTMKKFYQEQSNNSFIIKGDVTGWYKAKYNSEYYGKVGYRGEHDSNPKQLIKEALDNLIEDENIDLTEYDLRDPYDMDGDENYNEPDGVIDNLIVIHAGKGEEVGGGTLESNAIWSHRDTVSDIPYTKNYSKSTTGRIGIHNYTIVPEDAGTGVICHEFGHDLGLPDEYNTVSNEKDTPVGYWSLMAHGSWAGISSGTNPSGFSPWCKQILQNKYGGEWVKIKTIDINDIDSKGIDFILDEASSKGTNNEVVRINIPKNNPQDSGEKDRYYLIEWRNQTGSDEGLAYCEGAQLTYDPGMVIWYIDENFMEKDRVGSLTGKPDNDVCAHPGEGFIGVVDAEQTSLYWKNKSDNEKLEKASSAYHIHDAAFSLRKGKDVYVENVLNKQGKYLEDKESYINPVFDDSRDYSNKEQGEVGRILPKKGLKIYVLGESSNRSTARIHILREEENIDNYDENIKKTTSNYIKSIAVENNKITKDGQVKLSIETNVDTSVLDEKAYINYSANVKGEKNYKQIELHLNNGKYECSIKGGEFPLSEWNPEYLVIKDKNENVQIVYNSCLFNEKLGEKANKENLHSGSFKIVENAEAPEFKRVYIDKNEVKTGGKVNIKVEPSEKSVDLTENAYVSYLLEREDGDFKKEVCLKLINGIYEGDMDIDHSFKAGQWRIDNIRISNKQGHELVVYNYMFNRDNKGLGKDLSSGDIKIYYREDSGIRISCLNDHSDFIRGEEAKINFKIESGLKEEKSMILLAGIFDENNVLVDYVNKKVSIFYGEIKEESISIETENKIMPLKRYHIKAVVWDNLTNICPIGEEYKFQIVEDEKNE